MADSSEQDEAFALRNAASFFEKFERYECQELLGYNSSHWMLSSDDFKVPTDPPLGLISQMSAISEYMAFILFPVEDGIEELDLREVHQIVRELTRGIFVLNQLPTISLEANFDQSTSCQIPPAYLDTRVGQLLIDVDYMLKCLWHGCSFTKEKRIKFSDRWRGNLQVNANGKPETKKVLITEFTSAGMLDITKDPDYKGIYDNIPLEQPADLEMAEERRFFMNHADDLNMYITLFQKTVQQHHNMFIVDPDWSVSSMVKLTEDKLDHRGYQRLQARLQLHEILLRENLCNRNEVKEQMKMLKLVSFLVPFLVGMRKKMRIPDMNRMLPNLPGEDLKTERELPPMMLGSDFRCKNFSFANHYFHLHGGIQIDHETTDLTEPSQEIKDAYEMIVSSTTRHLHSWLDPHAPKQETYSVPIMQFGGQRYFAFALEFETFYGQSPQKPKWVHVMHEEIAKLKPKRLPIPDLHLHEHFKKFFGYKKAIKYKSLQSGLRAAAQRGLVAMFTTQCRKLPVSRLSKQDELGLTFVHYSAMFNRPHIITFLILQSMDINVKRINTVLAAGGEHVASAFKTGPTPLHLAARCGSLDAVCCLLANYANILATDEDGWSPIHHAAYFNHEPIIRLLIRRNEAMLELQTKNDIRSTPLLLAASSGALTSVRCLISLGTYLLRRDDEGNNIISVAALNFHTNILGFFIEWNHPEVPVWALLIGMLNEDDRKKKDAAVKCLEVMSAAKSFPWSDVMEAGGVAALVALLTLDCEDIPAVALAVLCNISMHDEVRRSLTVADAGPILVRLLTSPVDDIQSRSAIVIADLACVDGNQSSLAEQGAISALVELLDSEVEDVLVNAVNAVRVMCSASPQNQISFANHGVIEPLVEFLSLDTDILKAAAAAAISALCSSMRKNQDAVMREGAADPLVKLIKSHNITVEVKAASALEALCNNNHNSQERFLELDAPKAVMKLLKVWSMQVKEQGACSLWSLAGSGKMQQKYIAERISISHLMDMLLTSSDKLQYVGCMGMNALGKEDMESQNRVAAQGGLPPLVRLLRSPKTSENVLLTVIKVLGTMCIGLAHRNNRVTQDKIAEEGAISTLVQLLVSPPSVEIQVEVAYSLGCVVLGNKENQEKMREEPGFSFQILLELLESSDETVRLRAGFALAIFAFNNTPQQYLIREEGGISYQAFIDFLESEDIYHQCNAAFQTVVLARVIVDMDQVTLTAQGISQLVHVLSSDENNAVILAASLMSSLAHTRAGITDAMITVGALDLLIDKLYSGDDQVRFNCAVALGYLTFNRKATRLLLTACRNTPGLFEKLIKNIGKDPRISPDFTEEFKRCQIVGLPCLSLEIHGGPPVDPHLTKHVRRPHTSQSSRYIRSARVQSKPVNRAVSAPAKLRARSAAPCRPRSTMMTTTSSPKTNKISMDDLAVSKPNRCSTAKGKRETRSFLKDQLAVWEKEEKR